MQQSNVKNCKYYSGCVQKYEFGLRVKYLIFLNINMGPTFVNSLYKKLMKCLKSLKYIPYPTFPSELQVILFIYFWRLLFEPVSSRM